MNLFANWRRDLPASIVVFFVAVPLCLGIALASKAPLFSGLIAGMVGGLVVGALSGSPLGVSGPAAGLAVIVLVAIERLGSFESFLLAVVLAGLIQVGLGLARAGILGYFFPSSVIKGMLAGIGVLIVLKQIPHAFGYDADPEGDFSFFQSDGETTLSAFWNMCSNFEPVAIGLAVFSLGLLVFWERVLSKRGKFFRLIQGPLAVVAIGIAYQALTSRVAPDWALASTHLVDVPVPTDFDGFFALFTTPDWSRIFDSQVWIVAATMAVVASLETLLCVEATDKLDPQKRVTPANRELLAQGVGNTVSGLIGGLPVTQVIVRSSANIQSGAHGKLSAILHGGFILVAVVALPRVLNLVPLAILASILLVVGFKLAHPSTFRRMYGLGNSQFVPFAATVLGIVFTDLLTGIALGLAVALFVLLRRNYLNSHFLHLEERDEASGGHLVRIELSEEVSFLNRGTILDVLSRIPDGSHVVLDLSGCYSIDFDVVEIIQDFESTAERRNLTIEKIGKLKPGLSSTRIPAWANPSQH